MRSRDKIIFLYTVSRKSIKFKCLIKQIVKAVQKKTKKNKKIINKKFRKMSV